ncbi:hypothetical protein [Halobacillus campisalis]|uniref:Uncharacterized protein n=1 Tax=Halobacillus campisalis TaxID=435909 RepID=A0ABW2K5U8_9BACI|nr:hypothetical protein [Halobacillus campisalis]
MFFKNMTEKQTIHWRKGAIIGFYTYLILLFIDLTYDLLFAANAFSTSFIFWGGLIAAFGTELIFNLKDKRKLRKSVS